MNRIIMYVMAIGAVIGGLDRMIGNRYGLGRKFDEGMIYFGPTALAMVGIICLEPLFVTYLEPVLIPLFRAIGVDPAMFGTVLAIDMGGYQLAKDFAVNPMVGNFAAVIVSTILGCTLTFFIPVGMTMVEEEDRDFFSKGIMLGLAASPVVIIAGGLLCQMSLLEILWQSFVIFILILCIILGLWKRPDEMMGGFRVFAVCIKTMTTIGMILGAVAYMTGIELLHGMRPIEEAMAIVSGISIVLLGSLPVAEMLQRALKKPFERIGNITGMNGPSVAGILMCMVSSVPVFTLIKDMNPKGKIVNAAFMVTSTGVLGATMAFVANQQVDMVSPFVISKLLGGAAAVAVVLFAQREKTDNEAVNEESL